MKKINLTTIMFVVLFTFIASAGAGEVDPGPVNGVPVPEGGATFLLLTVGLTTLAALRRKPAK